MWSNQKLVWEHSKPYVAPEFRRVDQEFSRNEKKSIHGYNEAYQCRGVSDSQAVYPENLLRHCAFPQATMRLSITAART